MYRTRRYRRPNPELMIISNPVDRGYVPRNPVHVPRTAPEPIRSAYNSFHFDDPDEAFSLPSPQEWPQNFVVIGLLERFDVETPDGRTVSRSYRSNKPYLCTTAAMKRLYIIRQSERLGIPSGIAVRCDYQLPSSSPRNRLAKHWWHPHDSRPRVTDHRDGRSAMVSGPRLRISERGIIG